MIASKNPGVCSGDPKRQSVLLKTTATLLTYNTVDLLISIGTVKVTSVYLKPALVISLYFDSLYKFHLSSVTLYAFPL